MEDNKDLYCLRYEYKEVDSEEIHKDIWHFRTDNNRLIHRFMEKKNKEFLTAGYEIVKYAFSKVDESFIIEL